MQAETLWTPYQVLKGLWLPAQKGEDGYTANGGSGFATKAKCQAECNQRNRQTRSQVEQRIKELERELEQWRAILATHTH